MSNIEFKIYFDKGWDEFQVQVWVDGKLNKEKTCHTDNKTDAIKTKKAMEKELADFPERYQSK